MYLVVFNAELTVKRDQIQRPNSLYYCITKTSPFNKEPLTPHFYIVKLGFTGVYIFSYFCFKT